MPKATHEITANIFPALRYKDAPAAIESLSKAFGFETLMNVPNPDGSVAHAELGLDSGAIMLGSQRNDPGNPWSEVKQGLYVYVSDVEDHYRRAKAAGAEIVRDLQDTPYGSKEYSARDPEGFLWSFGSYRPGDYQP